MPASKNPRIVCPCCKGTGRATLSRYLSVTLQQFNGKKRLRAIDLQHLDPECGVSAFNNRLEKLRSLGFLSRERDGKFWRYFKPSKA